MARGSVRRRSGGWSYRVDIGGDPASGERRQVSRQGFTTKRAAEAAMQAVLQSIGDGTVVQRSKTTVAEFLDDWLAAQRHRLRPTTLASYDTAAV
ncbi:MAG TPA: Arm DNA-binding domain-containing protein, partial [Acidimicrobiales bacterium]|nr:Arm DNA-binding domain-containing protein [Acidimicrobiales bacterium]